MGFPKMPVKAWVKIWLLLAALIGDLWFSRTLWRWGEHVPAMIATVSFAGAMQTYLGWLRYRRALHG